MSNPIIIGIDHGYAAMKTAHCSFPTGLVQYAHEPYSSDHMLEYDGQSYVIGSGRQALQKDKTATESYYLLTLAAIAMELEARKLSGEAEVILAAGLPLTSFGRDKKAFRQYLLRDGKPVDFRYEGRPYRITIRDVQLFPQGYSAVICQPELLEQPSVIVADIGGWTVDLMEVDNQVPNAATCRSLELGVIRCLNEISEQLRRTLGLSLTNAQIESVMRGATTSLPREAKELIQKEAEQYISHLLSAIQECGMDYRAMPMVVLGGGASILARHVSPRAGLCGLFTLEDDKRNAQGFQRLCERMSGRGKPEGDDS